MSIIKTISFLLGVESQEPQAEQATQDPQPFDYEDPRLDEPFNDMTERSKQTFNRPLAPLAVGSFELRPKGCNKYEVWLDGQEVKHVTGVEVRLAVDELPRITLETIQPFGTDFVKHSLEIAKQQLEEMRKTTEAIKSLELEAE